LQEPWQLKVSPANYEEAQRIWENETESWRKTNYDGKRSKRSAVERKAAIPYSEINTMLNTVALAFICIGIVVLGGYFERKMREARNARRDFSQKFCHQISTHSEYHNNTVVDSHKITMSKMDNLTNFMQEKMDILIQAYREMLKQNLVNTPYPMKLSGGQINEDFATIVRITHWNVQWRDDNNEGLIPSSFIMCPNYIPRPQIPQEWEKLVRKFYDESGMTLEKPNEYDQENYDEVLDMERLSKEQLCRTPVCVTPDLCPKGKETRCQYCNGLCCNCENCTKFRAFFQIRTALINTGKINKWDYMDFKMMKQIQTTGVLIDHNKQIERIMKKLYEKARIDQPELPTSIEQLPYEHGHKLRTKLKKVAIRMVEGPMIKLVTSDERLNEMADELTSEIVDHFLQDHVELDKKTVGLMKWETQNYHQVKSKISNEEVEKTRGGSGVTVRFDCNTSSAAQEEEPSDCDSDEHSITELGYNVMDDDERFGEGPLDYVYHD